MIAVESSISWRNNVKNCNLTSIVSDISRYAGIHAGCVTHQHPARAWIPPRTLLRCRAGPGSEPGAGCPTRSAPPSACNRKHWSQKFPPDWHLCYNDEYWKLYRQQDGRHTCGAAAVCSVTTLDCSSAATRPGRAAGPGRPAPPSALGFVYPRWQIHGLCWASLVPPHIRLRRVKLGRGLGRLVNHL